VASGLAAFGAAPARCFGEEQGKVLGQGQFRYRVVPGWGVLGAETPVRNCHGIVCDREGHVILLTDHTANNVVVYDKGGRLVHKWGNGFPGAHGLSIVTEGSSEVLYLTDLQTHRVVKTTLDGKVLQEWCWPEQAGKYEKEADYRPSWTLHHPDGGFFVLDGYGRDYITRYDSAGRFLSVFGGAEGGITHWGPHGGMMDNGGGYGQTLLVAMSDQQHLLRLSEEGAFLERVDLPGGNPRQIRKQGGFYFVAHLADNWPKDRNSRGFISVLDSSFRVVANIGGTVPQYDDAGKLRPMAQEGGVFMHPHDVVVDAEGSLYVAQFASGQTYPLKLERL
jgi:hypothetical protein